MIKKFLLITCFCFSVLSAEEEFNNFFDTWSTWNTFYFDIYYYNEDEIADIVRYGDQVYAWIMEDFGWLYFDFPKKVNIYVYRNAQEYAKETKMSQWAGGHADLKANSIYTYEQKNLMENVVVHELTHLVFDAYMGYPRRMAINWLHEGVAVYEEKKILKKRWNMGYLKKLDKKEKLLTISDLLKTHTGLQKTSEEVSLWYFQVGTLVAYLNSLDKDGFRIFTENLQKYNNVIEALKITYPWNFRNAEELETGWKEWLYQQEDVI